MTIGLSDNQIIELRDILAECKSIDKGIVFGSRAKGTFRPASDVDLALVGSGVTLQDQIHVSARLNENKSLLKFDVIRLCALTNTSLIEHIQNEGVIVYLHSGR